jgi:hypothetical protein
MVSADTTISAVVPQKTEISGLTGTLKPGYKNSYLLFKLSPTVDDVRISDLDVQWKPLTGNTTSTGKIISDSAGWWGFACTTGNCTAEITSAKVTMENTSGKPYHGSLLQSFVNTWSDYIVDANVGVPGSACSVSVNTLPKIADLHPGQSVNDIELTYSGSGTGTLFFKPSDYEGNKGKILNDGGKAITYSVTGATWDSAKSGWSGDMSDHALKLDDIATTLPVGVYTGTMSVQISCL